MTLTTTRPVPSNGYRNGHSAIAGSPNQVPDLDKLQVPAVAKALSSSQRKTFEELKALLCPANFTYDQLKSKDTVNLYEMVHMALRDLGVPFSEPVFQDLLTLKYGVYRAVSNPSAAAAVFELAGMEEARRSVERFLDNSVFGLRESGIHREGIETSRSVNRSTETEAKLESVSQALTIAEKGAEGLQLRLEAANKKVRSLEHELEQQQSTHEKELRETRLANKRLLEELSGLQDELDRLSVAQQNEGTLEPDKVRALDQEYSLVGVDSNALVTRAEEAEREVEMLRAIVARGHVNGNGRGDESREAASHEMISELGRLRGLLAQQQKHIEFHIAEGHAGPFELINRLEADLLKATMQVEVLQGRQQRLGSVQAEDEPNRIRTRRRKSGSASVERAEEVSSGSQLIDREASGGNVAPLSSEMEAPRIYGLLEHFNNFRWPSASGIDPFDLANKNEVAEILEQVMNIESNHPDTLLQFVQLSLYVFSIHPNNPLSEAVLMRTVECLRRSEKAEELLSTLWEVSGRARNRMASLFQSNPENTLSQVVAEVISRDDLQKHVCVSDADEQSGFYEEQAFEVVPERTAQ